MPESSRGTGVAIVDDDIELVRTYELIFRKRRVSVVFVAYDGKSALDQFRNANARPDVVIIDYRMPLMNGIELTVEIKKLELCTKVVFISADDSVRKEAIQAGADVFLKKPVGIKAIIDSIGPINNKD